MSKISVDTARLPLLLHELRLPAINRLWQDIAARADKEGWPAIRFLSALAELEVAERARRRIERHLAESRLPTGKTLDSFDFTIDRALQEIKGHAGGREIASSCGAVIGSTAQCASSHVCRLGRSGAWVHGSRPGGA
jgi:hypothetical protein